MQFSLAIAGIIGAAAIGAFSWKLLAQDTTSSVSHGVDTQAPAVRGQELYSSSCASCHGEQLAGGETAPALSGGGFLSNWDGLTVGQLFDRTRTGMPPGAPAKVTRAAKLDIIAYILSFNKFPPGDKELP